MDNNLASFSLDPKLLQPIIETHIKGAIASILGEPGQVMEKVISQIMTQKVDEHGRISNYSSDNKYNYIDIVFRNTISRVAKEEIENWAKENAGTIRESIRKQLATKKCQDSFAKSVVDGLVKCASSNYSVRADLKFESSGRE